MSTEREKPAEAETEPGEAASGPGGDAAGSQGETGEGLAEAPAGGVEPASGDAKPAPGADADRVAALERELAAARAELADAEARLQRAQADFANYRRRMMAEQQRWGDRAVAQLAGDLLPVVDNLERALAAPGGDLAAFRQGIELTLRQLRDVLAGYDIRPIEAQGQPFDPRRHEAVGQVETDEVPEDYVAVELRRGYTFKGEVLRPALVQVARRPADPDSRGVDASNEEGTQHGESGGD